MSLCPHGYTAFWDCPTCPESLGNAPAFESEAVFPATVICAECNGAGCVECHDTGEVVAP